MPEVGRTPGAAEPLQEVGSGPDKSLDLTSRFTRLLNWLQLEGRVPVSLFPARMTDCNIESSDQLLGNVPAHTHTQSESRP